LLTEAFKNADRLVAKRAFESMMTMTKIDVGRIKAAVEGR
jgi:predicted 3-demethylubiquinone-9 3-methyltransferase (glyoxalase superfamily)